MDNTASTQQSNISPAQQDQDLSANPDTTNYIITTKGNHQYFHLSADCKFVIAAGNYTSISGSAEKLTSQGYIKCNCVEMAP